VRPAATATVAGVLAALAVFIFGMVVLNIYVAESSFRLEHLQKQVAVQQYQYRQMRYQVALAQSPSRLAETAQKLGLTPPDDQSFLPGRQLEAPTRATDANSEAAAGQHLKALLGKQS